MIMVHKTHCTAYRGRGRPRKTDAPVKGKREIQHELTRENKRVRHCGSSDTSPASNTSSVTDVQGRTSPFTAIDVGLPVSNGAIYPPPPQASVLFNIPSVSSLTVSQLVSPQYPHASASTWAPAMDADDESLDPSPITSLVPSPPLGGSVTLFYEDRSWKPSPARCSSEMLTTVPLHGGRITLVLPPMILYNCGLTIPSQDTRRWWKK